MNAHAPVPARTYDQWKAYFREEAEFHVSELQRLGEYISDPTGYADRYASGAAMYAVLRGEGKVDFSRAREMAERQASIALKNAGRGLDSAQREFARVSADPHCSVEQFGTAESRYLTAKQAYLTLLVEVTGEDREDLERRVAA